MQIIQSKRSKQQAASVQPVEEEESKEMMSFGQVSDEEEVIDMEIEAS